MMWSRRRGFTLAIVLILAMVLLGFVSVLFFRSRAQRDTFRKLELQAKALAAARGLMQVALYKFRVLPTEFYQVASAVRELPPAAAAPYQAVWQAELESDRGGDIARHLTDSLRQFDGHSYQVGINKYELLTRMDSGYRRDFLRLEVWGQCESERRVIEELLEVELSHD